MDLSGVDVEDLIVRLDLKNGRLSSSGLELNFSCYTAFHNHGDESPSAYINTETAVYFCHACKAKGNAVTLVAEVQQISTPEAERKLREWYGIAFDEPVGGSMVAETEARFREKEPPPEPIRPPRSWLSSARVDWMAGSYEPHQQYMLGRGFSPQVLADWDIGYDFFSDRLTIPLFDIEGELVGIKARAWREDHQPKYLILGDRRSTTIGFDPYEAANVVFGLHRNRERKMGVLCEGELNAVALSQLGVVRPIATGMSYLTSRHCELIIRELDEVVIFYDHGTAGHEGTWGRRDQRGRFHPGAVQLLEKYIQVRIVNAPPEDPAKLLELGRGHECLDLIEDAPSSVALRLLFR